MCRAQASLPGASGQTKALLLMLACTLPLPMVSHARTIRVWDAKSGETSSVLEGHKDNVTSICISSDTTRVR